MTLVCPVISTAGSTLAELATVNYQQLGLSRQHWTSHQLSLLSTYLQSIFTCHIISGRETNFPASAVVSRSRWSGHCLKREVGPYFSTWQRNRTPHQWYYPLKGRTLTVCHQFSFHIFISAQSLNYLKYQESTNFPGIYYWVAFRLKLNQTKAWTFSKHGIVRWSMVIHRSKGQ